MQKANVNYAVQSRNGHTTLEREREREREREKCIERKYMQ